MFYLVVVTTVFICLPMTFVVETDEGGATVTAMMTSCSVLCKPAHMVIVQLIHVTHGSEEKELLVGYLKRRKKKDKCKLSYNNMQTNNVCQKIFLIFFLLILFVNNKPLKYRK